MRKTPFLLLLILLTIRVSAQSKTIGEYQNSDEIINPETFDARLFCSLLFSEVNRLMDSLTIEGFEYDDFLYRAAKNHVSEMVENNSLSDNKKSKVPDVVSRLRSLGGSGIGDELVLRFSLKGSNGYYTYKELARNVLLKWETSSKDIRKLKSGEFYFGGIASDLDESKRKVYVSFFLGNYYTQNKGVAMLDEMQIPYTTKKMGLKPSDNKTCRRINRYFPDLVDLQKGLSINENNEIIFEFNDLKRLKRLVRDKNDALAVDIVQKSQYLACNELNSVDYTLPNRGIMTKPLKAKKLYKNNLASDEDGGNKHQAKFKAKLGELPELLNPEDVELNLIIIQDKMVCKNIPPSFLLETDYMYDSKIELLPDTIVPQGVPAYVPVSDGNTFTFRIPFEQNKYNYKMEDIQPVINTLNKPDFVINKVHVEAYSSIEGSIRINEKLQKQRAESIIAALKKNQNESLIESVISAPNWKDFNADIVETEYKQMAEMTMEQAIKYINENNLAERLEPLLAKHRYADVTVWVTYDVSVAKEEKYVIKQFNKAIQDNDVALALSIQKYMIKKLKAGYYGSASVNEITIPDGEKYAGLTMNKICMRKMLSNDALNETDQTEINHLAEVDAENPFILYNKVFCQVFLSNLDKEPERENLQREIEYLYDFQLSKKTVDLLNIEYQYRLMNKFKDSLGNNHPVVTRCLDKIKDILIFDEMNWQNSLKLSNVFINHGDYDYAFKLLEPFMLENTDIYPDLLFTYIGLCSKVEHKYHSNKLVLALEKARETDENRFCQLFQGKNAFPVQVFANDKIKKMYCETCKNSNE